MENVFFNLYWMSAEEIDLCFNPDFVSGEDCPFGRVVYFTENGQLCVWIVPKFSF